MPTDERQVEKKPVVYRDPFGGHTVINPRPDSSQCDVEPHDTRALYSLKLDPTTGDTTVEVKDYEDQQEVIKQFFDQCGMEGMRKLIAAGQARPSDFYDDGKSGGDFTGLPDNVNDAYRKAQEGDSKSKEVLSSLGVSVVTDEKGNIDMAATEEAINKAIDAKFKAIQAQSKASSSDAVKEKGDSK